MKYLVRRLTPTECALLQGFPPDWCSNLETPEPTEDDISFCKLLEKFLTKKAYDVTIAFSAAEARLAINKELFTNKILVGNKNNLEIKKT